MTLSSSITELRGVGSAKAAAFEKAGVRTLRDLIHYYPRAYQNRGDVRQTADVAAMCRTGNDVPPVSLVLTVSAEPKYSMIRRGMTLVKLKAFDESGVVEITYFNQPYMKDVFHTGETYRFWGRAESRQNRLTMANPVFEPYGEDGSALSDIVPVYPLTKGLKQKFVAMLVGEALKAVSSEIVDFVPPSVLRDGELCTPAFALKNIHFPADMQSLEAARRRLAFDEIYTVSAAMAFSKQRSRTAGAFAFKNIDVSPFIEKLPYTLTGAQLRSINEIAEDMSGDIPMCRILCGDVGSGKTAVAAAAAYIATSGGKQCALMAPTEILAKQHYSELAPMFEALGIRCELLCGSLGAAQKHRVKESLAGPFGADFVVGTHALLSEGVEFDRLGLVITDEQHRFGVGQRAKLRQKAGVCHTLVMSATPIPRTLSLAIFGDLDVSRLDEMPPGRQKVSTFKVDESYRARLLGFIKKQKEEGHCTYVVCPSIEEGEPKTPATEDPEELFDICFEPQCEPEPPMKAAVQFAKTLAEALPGLSVDFVHGKMNTAQKDRAMEAFAGGKTDVLVSTTVIEVGVNVPRATLMVVENAERFGLSQLHQLRGRVGRGEAKSWCILVSDTENPKSLARLEVMCKTNDGYRIAEEDLKQRGPGDFFATSGGFRQHGAMDMPFSSNMADMTLISFASGCAAELIGADPFLSDPANAGVRGIILRMLSGSEDSIS